MITENVPWQTLSDQPLVLQRAASDEKGKEEIKSISCAYVDKLPVIAQIVKSEKEDIWKLKVIELLAVGFYQQYTVTKAPNLSVFDTLLGFRWRNMQFSTAVYFKDAISTLLLV